MRVWWPDDGAFYEARIKAWDRERDVHTLLYILDGVEVRMIYFIFTRMANWSDGRRVFLFTGGARFEERTRGAAVQAAQARRQGVLAAHQG